MDGLGDTLKVPEKGVILDERLKELMQELGNAINESLSDSDRIAGAIGEIKRAGYDVFLVLEATIGFNKREEGEEGDEGDEGDEWGRYRVVGFHAAFLTEATKTAPPAKVHPTHCYGE